jgi:hypothetical protein
MFGSKSFLKDGAQVDGVLIQSDSDKVAFGGDGSYHARVRVTFEDGTTGEFNTRLHVREVGMRNIGAVVPVRYDATNRSKIDVDAHEIRRRHDLADQQRKAASAAVPATLPAGDPAAQLQSLWEQLKVMDARGSELRRSGAPRDQVGAWVAEKEALDARYRALKNHHPEWVPIH